LETDLPVASDIDLIAGAFYADDPYRAFRWMCEHEPVFYDRANDIYGISRHADIMAISKDSETFCSGRGFRPDAPNLPMMINMDRPEHMTRRNLVNSGFTPRKAGLLEPRIRELRGQIIEAACQKSEFDFVTEVAAPLPLFVVAELLGVKPEDNGRLLGWSDDLVHALGSSDPELLARQAQALSEWSAYNAMVVADRRNGPPPPAQI
jgi:cytochrome P450 family 142 subfamily A polypeptide 1